MIGQFAILSFFSVRFLCYYTIQCRTTKFPRIDFIRILQISNFPGFCTDLTPISTYTKCKIPFHFIIPFYLFCFVWRCMESPFVFLFHSFFIFLCWQRFSCFCFCGSMKIIWKIVSSPKINCSPFLQSLRFKQQLRSTIAPNSRQQPHHTCHMWAMSIQK